MPKSAIADGITIERLRIPAKPTETQSEDPGVSMDGVRMPYQDDVPMQKWPRIIKWDGRVCVEAYAEVDHDQGVAVHSVAIDLEDLLAWLHRYRPEAILGAWDRVVLEDAGEPNA